MRCLAAAAVRGSGPAPDTAPQGCARRGARPDRRRRRGIVHARVQYAYYAVSPAVADLGRVHRGSGRRPAPMGPRMPRVWSSPAALPHFPRPPYRLRCLVHVRGRARACRLPRCAERDGAGPAGRPKIRPTYAATARTPALPWRRPAARAQSCAHGVQLCGAIGRFRHAARPGGTLRGACRQKVDDAGGPAKDATRRLGYTRVPNPRAQTH